MHRTLIRTPLAAALVLAGAGLSGCAQGTSQASTAAPAATTQAAAGQQGGGQQGGGEMEQSRSVAGGGISAPGWMGRVDANEAAAGQTVANAKLIASGNTLQVTTGPAIKIGRAHV